MNYWRLLIITIVLSAVSLFLISWINKPDIKNADSTGTNIIAFGDSLVYGVGSTPGNDMFSLVSKEIGIPIINKGVSGNTTQDALARIDRDVLNNNPRIVFVLLGGNDFLQNVPKEETFNNLEEIIKEIQSKGAAVILLGVRGGVGNASGVETEYENLSKKYKTGYVPNVLDGLILNRQYMYDSIHPNDKGYKIISNRITPVIESILNK